MNVFRSGDHSHRASLPRPLHHSLRSALPFVAKHFERDVISSRGQVGFTLLYGIALIPLQNLLGTDKGVEAFFKSIDEFKNLSEKLREDFKMFTTSEERWACVKGLKEKDLPTTVSYVM